MAVISVTEGQTNTIQPEDTLLYPGISSCITITGVTADGIRYGGHAVITGPPEGEQNLQEITTFIHEGANCTQYYIIGQVDLWDEHWTELEETAFLRDMEIGSLQQMAEALNFLPLVIVDTTNIQSTSIYFNSVEEDRTLQWTRNGEKQAIPDHPNW